MRNRGSPDSVSERQFLTVIVAIPVRVGFRIQLEIALSHAFVQGAVHPTKKVQGVVFEGHLVEPIQGAALFFTHLILTDSLAESTISASMEGEFSCAPIIRALVSMALK